MNALHTCRPLQLRLARCAAAAVAATATYTGAWAQMHQICFRGATQTVAGNRVGTAIFGCAFDGGGRCSITPGSGLIPFFVGYSVPDLDSPGSFGYYKTQGSGPFEATIDFFDSAGTHRAQRSCRIESALPASPGAVLTGFTTDASGLATTGVWRLQEASEIGSSHLLKVLAPGDFVAVGGGAMGVEGPYGALVAMSARDPTTYPRGWVAWTQEAGGAAQPHRTTAYVIGLRIDGLAQPDLERLLRPGAGYGSNSASSSSMNVPHPTVQVSAVAGSVVIGGGFGAYAYGNAGGITQLGQFGTVNAPLATGYWDCSRLLLRGSSCSFVPTSLVGWQAESKDHVIPAPGWDVAEVMALPATLILNGRTVRVESGFVSATSAEAAHPVADVGGLRGQYALTGIGAAVDWRRYDAAGNQIAAGNLLWKLQPRPDLGGASVASKDHWYASPAKITAHAIGLRLVP